MSPQKGINSTQIVVCACLYYGGFWLSRNPSNFCIYFSLFSGEKKRVPIYVPPPLPEDEEHIFETIQKGINFDKYDQINVECTGREALTERDTIRRLFDCTSYWLTL